MSTVTAAPKEVQEAAAAAIESYSVPLYKNDLGEEESLLTRLQKAAEVNPTSNQGVAQGDKPHPFDMEAVVRFQTANVHHATCIHTKVASTVGLGFRDEDDSGHSKADEALNPLCESTFQAAINDVAEDYWQAGQGYLEVVRAGSGGEITGLHHMAAPRPWVHVEDDGVWWYVMRGGEGAQDDRPFPVFGQKDMVLAREGMSAHKDKPQSISEIIPFRRPTSLSRWYGFPDWMSAVPSIELVQMMLQQRFDFFLNRGVPEFMLFILGQKLPKEDWDMVLASLRANIGRGNSHKSFALNLSNPEIKVELVKMAMEGKGDDSFAKDKENLALDVVSAHRVPPLLAGIQIPGKLGATNELPNALMAFQLLVIGPAQKLFQEILNMTLGGEKNLGLKPRDFRFKKITDEIDLGMMDTVGRMRETVPGAKGKGRDLKAGVKD